MRINWAEKRWTIWEIDCDAVIGRFKRIVINVPCELVNTDGSLRGMLVVAGVLRIEGETAFIDKEEIADG